MSNNKIGNGPPPPISPKPTKLEGSKTQSGEAKPGLGAGNYGLSAETSSTSTNRAEVKEHGKYLSATLTPMKENPETSREFSNTINKSLVQNFESGSLTFAKNTTFTFLVAGAAAAATVGTLGLTGTLSVAAHFGVTGAATAALVSVLGVSSTVAAGIATGGLVFVAVAVIGVGVYLARNTQSPQEQPAELKTVTPSMVKDKTTLAGIVDDSLARASTKYDAESKAKYENATQSQKDNFKSKDQVENFKLIKNSVQEKLTTKLESLVQTREKSLTKEFKVFFDMYKHFKSIQDPNKLTELCTEHAYMTRLLNNVRNASGGNLAEDESRMSVLIKEEANKSVVQDMQNLMTSPQGPQGLFNFLLSSFKGEFQEEIMSKFKDVPQYIDFEEHIFREVSAELISERIENIKTEKAKLNTEASAILSQQIINSTEKNSNSPSLTPLPLPPPKTGALPKRAEFQKTEMSDKEVAALHKNGDITLAQRDMMEVDKIEASFKKAQQKGLTVEDIFYSKSGEVLLKDLVLKDRLEGETSKILNSLVNIGVDLNHQFENGNTLLHMAAQSRNERIVSALLNKDVKINILNQTGITAKEIITSATYGPISKVKDILKIKIDELDKKERELSQQNEKVRAQSIAKEEEETKRRGSSTSST